VMSLDGRHMAIVKRLAMANHTHTWWRNMSPLTNRAVEDPAGRPVDVYMLIGYEGAKPQEESQAGRSGGEPAAWHGSVLHRDDS